MNVFRRNIQNSTGYYSYEDVLWNEWIKLHRITYNWAVEKYKSLKPTDFTYI